MVNVKKKKYYLCYFVILLTFTLIASCKSKINHLQEIEGKQININDSFASDATIDAFVSPYKNHINKDLDSVLAYNPITQDKSKGKWETNIGNLFAQTTFQLASPIFEQRTGKKIDFCILNHGGIRAIIPQGNVSARTAFEIMPFENNIVIVELTKAQVFELAQFFIKYKKPHPLYNIKIYTNSDKITEIQINGKPLDNKLDSDNTIYYVLTSDYLANGGDNMTFLSDSPFKYDLDYKLRNLFIDYLKKTDTLPNLTTKNILETATILPNPLK